VLPVGAMLMAKEVTHLERHFRSSLHHREEMDPNGFGLLPPR
jgi:hypothetical protein